MEKVKAQVMRRFDLPPEKIFEAFLDPKKASKFMFATENGEMIKAEIDPKVGGSFLFVDRRPTGDASHYGTWIELIKPKKIKFTFAVQKEAEGDPVTIDISPQGKGCKVTLTHEMDAKYANLREKVAEGWNGILAGLAMALAG